MAELIRNEGMDVINEVEIRVENEIREGDIGSLFNEWKGH
jgi:hypothetical protein